MPPAKVVRAAFLLSAAAMAATPLAAEASVSVSRDAESAATRLKALFADSNEGTLKRNPYSATVRGDPRYADHLGDMFTSAHHEAERAANKAELARLKTIDRAALDPIDQVARDVFEWRAENNLKNLAPDILALTSVRPLDHFSGFHTYYPGFATGQSALPFKTLSDYENNLKRHMDYVVVLGRAIARFREGMASGVTQPKLVVERMIEQFDTQARMAVEDSPFYRPVTAFPDSISAADQARLKAEYATLVRDHILPANARIRDFLKNEYLPVAREGVGLVHMPGGETLYARLIEHHTTLPYAADEIHRIGLSEVKRIRDDMEAIREKVGFAGTLAQFFDHLRTSPQFKLQSREEMTAAYYAIGRRVDERVRSQFSTIPKTPIEIRPFEEWREKTQAGGAHQTGIHDPKNPARNRPGIFYFNAYDLPSRLTTRMEALYLHEAIPGHHFQNSLAAENDALPDFMRYSGYTAFVEGWALYAESLWEELGMETDPYQRFGGLDDEMLRAMRLVVDSGIHANGWSREQAIRYMLENSGMGETDATAEVDRYIAMPGQALGYKIGALTIKRLKAKAQHGLGRAFDPRAFHAEVLMTGALPMAVLEKKIDNWIRESIRNTSTVP